MPTESVDDVIKRIMDSTETIAVVGMSAKPDRDSYRVAMYLKDHGFNVIPVNPQFEEIDGMTCYPSVMAIPDEIRIDVVDVFRRSEECPPVVEEAVARGAKAVWLQMGIVSDEAAGIARSGGVDFVMDRCMKVEHGRRR